MSYIIDTNYDVRKDIDVDAMSITLKKYHRKLWSKSLPNGKDFTLFENKNEYHYLIHKSDLGVFYLSSDIITATYSNWE